MRDLIGYAGNPPDACWPGDARIAVNFVLNYEEGSESTILDGDGRVETGLAETVGGRIPPGERDLAFESMYEYGSRVGVWRILRLFRERHLPMTIFGCAMALERNPSVTQMMVNDGHDFCSHGWRWVEPFRLTEEQERDHIQIAISTIKKLTGARPEGWYCRYGPSTNTRRLLVQEGGFLYDSDAYNDELPYWQKIEGKSHLVVPYTMDANDGKFCIPAGFATGSDFYEYLRATFDMLYYEGATTPKMMSIGLHCRITGRPARAEGLARFLDYVLQHEKVWVTRRIDIARHWHKFHPVSS